MTTSGRRPILVLGCGSIGRRHIANLQRLGRPTIAFDPDPGRRRWVERELGCETLSDAEQGLERRPDAVWVCAPPHLHASLARPALAEGIPCFIEKPLAHTVREARGISALARSSGAPVSVGYMLRWHPGLRWLRDAVKRKVWGRPLFVRAEWGQYLPDWRPWQDYRKSYTASRAMGGGVLLDASHEIDLLRWLFGDMKSVFCAAGTAGRLGVDVEDNASMVVRFESGISGEIHLDMLQRAYRRTLQVAFEEGTALWDFPTAELKLYSARTKRWTSRAFPIEVNQLYVREAKAFLAHLKTPREDAVVPAEDGLKTLAVVEAAKRSAKSLKMETI